MARVCHAAGSVALLVSVLLAVLVVPASGQQPYPPPPPPGGPPARAEVDCDVRMPRRVACEGEGYLAGSTVTIEIHAVGGRSGGRRIASDTVVVGADGTWDYSRALGCEAPTGRVRVRVSGRDAGGRPSTDTFVLDVGQPAGCSQVAAGGEAEEADSDENDGQAGADGDGGQAGANGNADGRTDVAGDVRERGAGPTIGGVHVLGAADTQADGSLALTGRNLTLLAAVALVLVTLGTVLVSARRWGGRARPTH